MGPKCNMTGVLIRRGEKTQRQRQTSGDGHVMTKGRDWSDASTSQDTSEAKRKPWTRFSPRAFREYVVIPTP